MIAIVDRTNLTPSQNSSEMYTAYEDFGPRPVCVDCDAIEECPECPADIAYKVPVVHGDILYFQFNLEDSYNEDPSRPDFGWLVDPSDDYWISAEVDFAVLPSLPLPDESIILSNSVGWYEGSYQNLIINTENLYNYMFAEGQIDCFRFKITTYKKVAPNAIVASFIGNTLPDVSGFEEGQYAIEGTDIYILDDNAWTFYQAATEGTIVFGSVGKYYMLTGGSWEVTEPTFEYIEDRICYTSWHKFMSCEQTVLIYAIHGRTDCNGKYFGEPFFQSTMPYLDVYRIEGNMEMRSLTIQQTKNENDVLTEYKQFENWILRNAKPFPDQIARRLANSFSAARFTIDGNEFLNVTDVTKRNESGNYWWVEIILQRLLCEKENDCGLVVTQYPFVVPPSFSPCPDPEPITVSNSDDSYLVETNVNLELPDTTIEVYIDEVLQSTTTIPSVSDYIINIIWV